MPGTKGTRSFDFKAARAISRIANPDSRIANPERDGPPSSLTYGQAKTWARLLKIYRGEDMSKIYTDTESSLATGAEPNLGEDLRRALKQVANQYSEIETLRSQLNHLIRREVEYERTRIRLEQVRVGLRLIVQSVENGHHEVYREQIRDLATVLADKLDEV